MKKLVEVDLYKFFNLDKKTDGGVLKGSVYSDEERPLILVIPGGAYTSLCYRENTPFAKKFFDLGYNAFYLDYSCGDGVEYLTSLKEFFDEKEDEKIMIQTSETILLSLNINREV